MLIMYGVYIKEGFEIKIYDINNVTYNIGDLLLMPKLYCQSDFKDTSILPAYYDTIKTYPNSILSIYEKLRKNKEEIIPNIDILKKATDNYILLHPELNNLLDIINNDDVLCIHLRGGNVNVEEEYIDKIKNISKNYKKIIICTGIHGNNNKNEWNEAELKNNLLNTINSINIPNIEINLEPADTHLCIFRKCKNLLIHKGGFSCLGSLLFNGTHLYITNIFDVNKYLNCENSIWKNSVFNYTII
jgi:hypothetical protein